MLINSAENSPENANANTVNSSNISTLDLKIKANAFIYRDYSSGKSRSVKFKTKTHGTWIGTGRNAKCTDRLASRIDIKTLEEAVDKINKVFEFLRWVLFCF